MGEKSYDNCRELAGVNEGCCLGNGCKDHADWQPDYSTLQQSLADQQQINENLKAAVAEMKKVLEAVLPYHQALCSKTKHLINTEIGDLIIQAISRAKGEGGVEG